MSAKPSLHSVLSYWNATLLDDAQAKIFFNRDNLISVDDEVFSRGVLPAEVTMLQYGGTSTRSRLETLSRSSRLMALKETPSGGP